MPKILGLEPERWKPIALIGGGGLVLFLFLKSRQPAPVAASVPDGGPQQGVSSVAVQPELSASGQTATALQQQLQGQDTAQQTALFNLSLRTQEQQLKFQGQQDAFQLQREQSVAAQQDAVTHEEFKQLKRKGQTGGFLGGLLNTFGIITKDIGGFTGGVNAASQAAQSISNFGAPQQQTPQQRTNPSPTADRETYNIPMEVKGG